MEKNNTHVFGDPIDMFNIGSDLQEDLVSGATVNGDVYHFDLNGIKVQADISTGKVEPESTARARTEVQNKTDGKIKIQRDPYVDKEYLYARNEYQFKPGLTVLVGCNGAGKTSLLQAIEHLLDKEKVPVMMYDNLHDGGHNARSSALFRQQFEVAATLMCSSEGEQISINIGQIATKIGAFVRKNMGKPEIWILFDAIDSGLSVDNVVEIKDDLFRTILETTLGSDVYIIVSANEYEMCRGEQCFSVASGEYTTFDDYEQYRKFILESRKTKDLRYKKSATKRRKKQGAKPCKD